MDAVPLVAAIENYTAQRKLICNAFDNIMLIWNNIICKKNGLQTRCLHTILDVVFADMQRQHDDLPGRYKFMTCSNAGNFVNRRFYSQRESLETIMETLREDLLEAHHYLRVHWVDNGVYNPTVEVPDEVLGRYKYIQQRTQRQYWDSFCESLAPLASAFAASGKTSRHQMNQDLRELLVNLEKTTLLANLEKTNRLR